MAYNSENAKRCVFDIETAPLDDAADYIEQATAPANYKDQSKIDAFVAAANSENLSKCALDVDLCRVVAIGWWMEGEPQPMALHVGHTSVDEGLVLRSFWNLMTDRHLVGFNCLGFDLPVLLRRSLYLGVDAPAIQIDRFKHPNVSDVMQVLSFNGALKFRGLAFYAKRFGLNIPDPMSGAEVGQAVLEGRWGDVEAHVKADVAKTAALASKLGLFSA